MKTVRTSWKQIRRTPYQALATVFIMMFTFLSVSVFFFIVLGSSVTIKYIESKPQVIAFFKDEAKQDEISQLENTIKSNEKVSKTRFVSKKEALQIYREQNKEDPLLLDLVTEDILPASLEISTNDIKDLDDISAFLAGSSIVEKVINPKDVSEQLSAWTGVIRLVGITIILILAFEAIFIMMMVIGFKVSQKKDEIEIMRLLSANNSYIREPFMIEGIMYGMVGAFIGWLIASAGLLSATPSLQNYLGDIPLLPAPPTLFIGLLVVELIIAGLLGVFASYLAVRRYLK